MTRIVLASAAAVICLVLASAAFASVRPTAAQSKAITAAVKAYIKNPSSHAASDNKIANIAISSVDSHFAGVRLKSVSGNSTALVKLTGKRWKVIGFGPAQSCSLASKAVRADLGVKCGEQ